MDYRREIDGLRALAVVPVILFHAGFTTFSGGFVGVDIFFVISGYLITSLLLAELQQDRLSIVAFYERRARRILPALFAVMLFCVPLAWYGFFSSQLRDFSQSLIAVSTFVSNVLFWRESGYFDASGELKPLLHTWSLSVEEQFYLLFPLGLALMWKWGRRGIPVTLGIVCLASLAAAEWAAPVKPAAAFYLLPSRIWELLVGALAACYLARTPQRPFGPMASEIGAWAGVLLMAWAVFGFSKSTPFPGVYALVPTLGALLIILFATPQTAVGRWFGHRVLVGIGLISYSAYLWHQPLLAFVKFRLYGELNPAAALAVVGVTFVVAFFSWKYIENPIRRRQVLPSRRALFSASAAALLAFIGMGVYGHAVNFLGKRSTPPFLLTFEAGSDYVADNHFLIGESWTLQQRINGIPFFGVENVPKDRELLFDPADRRQKLLVVGNSHSVDFYNVLWHSRRISAAFQIARFGTQIRNIDESLFASPNYRAADVVVYCSLMAGADIDHIERAIARAISDRKKVFVCQNMFSWMNRAVFTKLDGLILAGLRQGVEPARLSASINDRYSNDYHTGQEVDADVKAYALRLATRLQELASKHPFTVIDRMAYVCPQQRCRVVSESLGKYAFDTGHHTLLGARFFATVMDEQGIFLGLLAADGS